MQYKMVLAFMPTNGRFFDSDSVLSVKGLMYPTSQTVDETREARICLPTFEEGQKEKEKESRESF